MPTSTISSTKIHLTDSHNLCKKKKYCFVIMHKNINNNKHFHYFFFGKLLHFQPVFISISTRISFISTAMNDTTNSELANPPLFTIQSGLGNGQRMNFQNSLKLTIAKRFKSTISNEKTRAEAVKILTQRYLLLTSAFPWHSQ